MDYTTTAIAEAVLTWANFNGFTGEQCSVCKATANVLAGGPGWHCPCGHYNLQSWHCHMIPHEAPLYGPRQDLIHRGIQMARCAKRVAEARSGIVS